MAMVQIIRRADREPVVNWSWNRVKAIDLIDPVIWNADSAGVVDLTMHKPSGQICLVDG